MNVGLTSFEHIPSHDAPLAQHVATPFLLTTHFSHELGASVGAVDGMVVGVGTGVGIGEGTGAGTGDGAGAGAGVGIGVGHGLPNGHPDVVGAAVGAAPGGSTKRPGRYEVTVQRIRLIWLGVNRSMQSSVL